MKSILFILIFFLAIGFELSSQVIKVPEDYAKIQDAIDAAHTRDTVLVSPGQYFENINFRGKAIVVTSNFTYSGVFTDIAETIIDGSSPENPDTASCVIFCSGEGGSSILEGFTIRKGSGTRWIDPQFPDYSWHSGGGIFIYSSSPTIRNNLITSNDVTDPRSADGASGGGICMYDANPRICNNIIKSNQALYGCGLVVDYSGGIFKNNIIENNSGGQSYGGGAFWTIGNGDKPIIIENNTIVNNQVLGTGTGGAFYIWSTTTIAARNNIIWGNSQSAGGQVFLTNGGQISLSYSDIQGGYDGEGNIDSDPHLKHYSVLDPSSPCIDAGNPESKYNDLEDQDRPGEPAYPAGGALRNDMGAYGGQGCKFLYNTVSGIGIYPVSTTKQKEIHVYPNPFTDRITICFPDMDFKAAQIILYDQNGRLVFTKELCKSKKMNINLELEAFTQNRKGIYLLMIICGKTARVKKLVKT